MSVLAAVLAALAAWWTFAPPPDPRLLSIVGAPPVYGGRRPPPQALGWTVAGVSAAACLVAIPMPAGAVVGAGCLVMVPRVARRIESPAAKRARDALARQGPVVADLLAATLASGAAMRSAIGAVARAVGEPAASHLAAVAATLDLGADPQEAWQPLVDDPTLGAIAHAVARSARTGAPASMLLTRLAEDMRRERRTVVEVAARTAGVRAVLPLAACFLPAFLLLGVVPVVAALAGELLHG